MNRISWRGALRAPLKKEQKSVPQCVEASVHWNGTCLQWDQFDIASDKITQYLIGETPACQFMVGAQFIHVSEYSVVDITGDTVTVNIPPFARGCVQQGEITEPFSPTDTTRSHTLLMHGSVTFELGPWTFVFKRVISDARPIGGMGFNLVPSRWTYISMAAHAIFFLLIGLFPPTVSSMNFDEQIQQNRMIKVMITAGQKSVVIPEKMNHKEVSDGSSGQAHAGDQGKAGDKRARPTGKRMAVVGPPHTRKPTIGKELMKTSFNRTGILDFLDKTQIVSPLGEGTTIGRDPENILGNLLGDEIGVSHGHGGMGVFGPGRGGGGNGKGTVGVRDLGFGRFGHDPNGRCVGPLCKISGARPLKDNQNIRTRVNIRAGTSTVAGSLPKAVIRRFIRLKIRDIRFCYEKELAANEGLSGRVSVWFQINPNGAVTNSAVKESTIANHNVESCIAGVIRRITFPRPPDNGTVIVTYPFNLVQSSR